MFTHTSIKPKTAMTSPPGGSRFFPELRKIPPVPPFLLGCPAETSLEKIKLFKKRVSTSEFSEITAVASYVTDNLGILFLGLVSTSQGVTEIVTETK